MSSTAPSATAAARGSRRAGGSEFAAAARISPTTTYIAGTFTMTRITTPFGIRSTAAEVARGIDLAGRRMIVTGGAGGIGGRYFVDCDEAVAVTRRTNDMSGVAPYALDPAHARRLWDESLRLLAG